MTAFRFAAAFVVLFVLVFGALGLAVAALVDGREGHAAGLVLALMVLSNPAARIIAWVSMLGRSGD